MKKIDINKWHRKDVFTFYKNVDMPRYLMTFELDVTRFYDYVKKEKLSFYLSMIHQTISVMQEIDAYRYRIIDEDVFLYDSVHPSFTDMIQGTENFKIVTCDYKDDIKSFNLHAKKTSLEQGSIFIDLEKEKRDDLVYITTFPWATYTQVSHAHNMDNKDAIPRLVWGKFKDVNGSKIMPFSIEVHHCFVDGYHIGILIQRLQEKLNSI